MSKRTADTYRRNAEICAVFDQLTGRLNMQTQFALDYLEYAYFIGGDNLYKIRREEDKRPFVAKHASPVYELVCKGRLPRRVLPPEKLYRAYEGGVKAASIYRKHAEIREVYRIITEGHRRAHDHARRLVTYAYFISESHLYTIRGEDDQRPFDPDSGSPIYQLWLKGKLPREIPGLNTPYIHYQTNLFS